MQTYHPGTPEGALCLFEEPAYRAMGRTGLGWGQRVSGVGLVPAKAVYPVADMWEKSRREASGKNACGHDRSSIDFFFKCVV